MQQPFYIECTTLAVMSEEKGKSHDYYSQLIQDCVKELKRKHKTFCFSEEQLSSILKRVKANYTYSDGVYTLSPLEETWN